MVTELDLLVALGKRFGILPIDYITPIPNNNKQEPDEDGVDFSNFKLDLETLKSQTFLDGAIVNPIISSVQNLLGLGESESLLDKIWDGITDHVIDPITDWISTNMVTLVKAAFGLGVADDIIEFIVTDVSTWISDHTGGLIDTWLGIFIGQILNNLNDSEMKRIDD